MDALTSAAVSVFGRDLEEGAADWPIPITPKKNRREILSEVTHTINISPEKLHGSSLQSLFTGSTTNFHNVKKPGSSVSPFCSSLSPVREKMNGRSPLTPTSNLKLLTHIASMEESFTTKKTLFNNKTTLDTVTGNSPQLQPCVKPRLQRYNSDSISSGRGRGRATHGRKTALRKHCSTDDHSKGLPSLGRLAPLDETSTRPTESSRKDKSLGLLSEKFLEHFPMEVSFLETPRRMVIDEVAALLGTERRRVYDIINVLESLNMAAKVQKNMYQWMGKMYLAETLGRLKAIAIKLNLRAQVQSLQASNEEGQLVTCVKTTWDIDGEKGNSRREKSLGILCQKFLMLLLVSNEQSLSLDDALKMLMWDTCEENDRLRTRGRRLYDIANVLTSLGLVQRVPISKGFRYIGPEVEPIPSNKDSGMRLRHSLLPSCLWTGASVGKENTTCPADHDVTPSAAPPPPPRRGRPRKLSTDFTASTIPSAKRTKLQRTRSEDIMAGKQRSKFTRHPSLHDICQVAEVEREKLLLKEKQQQYLQQQQQQQNRQQQQQQQNRQQLHQQQQQQQNVISPLVRPIPVILSKENTSSVQTKGFQPIDLEVGPNVTSMLHQKYLPYRTKVPVALTFKKYNEEKDKEGHIITPVNTAQVPRASEVNSEKTSSQGQISSHTPQSEQRGEISQPTVISKPLTKPIPRVNKIILKSLNREASGAPSTAPTEAQQSKTPSVIRVVTNMGRASVAKQQREPPKVITVLSSSQTHKINQTTKQYVLQAGGSLKQVSPKTDNSGQTSSGHSHVDEGIAALREQTHSKPSSYTLYTISGSQLISSSHGERPALHGNCRSTTKSLSTSTWSDNSSPTTPRTGHQATSGFTPLAPRDNQVSREPTRADWLPTSDASSTDSELEEIFGDCFKFTRPKTLASGTNSQDRSANN